MPNCTFLAVGSDLTAVLDHVFASSDFTVYEAYSPPGAPMRSFANSEAIASSYPLGRCTGTAPSILLALLPNGSGTVVVERISLDPKHCGGQTFRFRAGGWGLIQLQLGGIGPRGLVPCCTNHNSKARALKWESTFPELGPAQAWNWPAVEAASRAINRFVRKLAVAKDGRRPVLPQAAEYMAGAQ